MSNKVLWPSLSSSSRSSGEVEGEEFEKFVPIFKADEDEHIVCGIVYEPDEVDVQGDEANTVEIRKAAYQFMEKIQSFRINHKGKPAKIKVLESYLAPLDFTLGTQQIKKGSWIMTLRINDSKVWKLIKSGKLKGFSMAGTATAEKG